MNVELLNRGDGEGGSLTVVDELAQEVHGIAGFGRPTNMQIHK